MRIDKLEKLSIELLYGDIDTLRNILKLAHMQLNNSPVRYCGDSTLYPRRCGLIGSELFNTQEMITKMGCATDIHLSFDNHVYDPTQVSESTSVVEQHTY